MYIKKLGLLIGVLNCATFMLLGCEKKGASLVDVQQHIDQVSVPLEVQQKVGQEINKLKQEDDQVSFLDDFYQHKTALQPSVTANLPRVLVRLENYFSSALQRNAEIVNSREQINQSEAEKLEAIYGYFPRVVATMGTDRNRQKLLESSNALIQNRLAQYTNERAGLRIDQPIVDIERYYAIEQGSMSEDMSKLRYAQQVQKTLFAVLETYMEAVSSQHRLQALEERVVLLQTQINLSESLDSNGLGNTVKLSSLRSQLNDVLASQALEASRLFELKQDMSVLVGDSVEKFPPFVFDEQFDALLKNFSLNDRGVEELVKDATQFNPSLSVASMRILLAELNRKRAMASDFAPSVSAFASHDYENSGETLFDGSSTTVNTKIGINVSINLFNGKGRGYTHRSARVALRRAMHQYHAEQREIENSVFSTYNRLKDLFSAITSANKSVVAAQEAVEFEGKRFNSGESSKISLAVTQQTLIQAEQRLRDYQTQFLISWVRLQFLRGKNLLNFS